MSVDFSPKQFFDSMDSLSQPDRERQQLRALTKMATLGYRRSPTVRRIFDERGMEPEALAGLDDLQRLPVISREQLVELQLETPPYGGLCDGAAGIDRIFISPGPVYEPHLSESEPIWVRGYHAAGFDETDVVLNTFSYHMVAAGLTFHNALRKLGATVVPSGTSSTDQQVRLIRDLDVTGFTGTPSFLLAIIHKAEEMGHDFKRDFKLRRAGFVAEPLQASLRRKFEQEYDIDTYQMYGATEVGDIAYECCEKNHWHICEEVIVEIVDPATGEHMQPGELGEVVVTRPNEIFFLFRFGTGDLSSLNAEPCPCGRTSYRLTGISGRVGEAAKVRGLFLAPSQMNSVSSKMGNMPFRIVVDRKDYRDFVSAILEEPSDTARRDTLAAEFVRTFKEICTVKVDTVEFAQAGSLNSSPAISDRRRWK
jgi:phenylacetate-CoA ligase